MSEPALAPRNAFVGVIVVWSVALLAAISIGFFVPAGWRDGWTLVAFGGVILLSFATQLWYGRADGFIFRVAASVAGGLLLMGLISVGFGAASLITAW